MTVNVTIIAAELTTEFLFTSTSLAPTVVGVTCHCHRVSERAQNWYTYIQYLLLCRLCLADHKVHNIRVRPLLALALLHPNDGANSTPECVQEVVPAPPADTRRRARVLVVHLSLRVYSCDAVDYSAGALNPEILFKHASSIMTVAL